MSKYIFISDLEGCEEKGRFGGGPQNTSMCKKEFYTALETKMDAESNTHICFLGDYFDQGPGALTSVVGISYLKSKFKERVHIIIGNRDLNKFRIHYEQDFTFPTENAELVKSCGFAPDTILEKSIKEDDRQMRLWMAKTMGINNTDDRNGLILDHNLSETDARTALLAAFNPENFNAGTDMNMDNMDLGDNNETRTNAFKKAIRIIYTNANMVEKIDDLLISHAGGYAKNICAKIPEAPEAPTDETDYFTKIHEYRQALTTATCESSDTISEAIEAHRTLYTNFIEAFSRKVKRSREIEGGAAEAAKKNHIQLQTMGLKPDNSVEQNGFVSFIESCDHTGPMGPNNPAKLKAIEGIMEMLPTYNAFGHINMGLNYPLIYQRGEKYMFACDTSVGSRPEADPFRMNMLDLAGEKAKFGLVNYKDLELKEINYDPKKVEKNLVINTNGLDANLKAALADADNEESLEPNKGGRRSTKKCLSQRRRRLSQRRKRTRGKKSRKTRGKKSRKNRRRTNRRR